MKRKVTSFAAIRQNKGQTREKIISRQVCRPPQKKSTYRRKGTRATDDPICNLSEKGPSMRQREEGVRIMRQPRAVLTD